MADWTGGLRNRSITAGTSSTDVSGLNKGRKYLLIHNLHGTNAIYVRFALRGEADEAPDAVADATPNIKVVAGGTLIFEGEFVPSGEFSIIASGANTPVTILEG